MMRKDRSSRGKNFIPNVFTRSFRPYLWFVSLGFLLYFKTLFFELTYLDDNVWVLDYHWYLKNPANIFPSFAQPDLVSGCFYRPILNISFMLNASSGGSLFGYHLVNLFIHLFNVCLVFIFYQRFGLKGNTAFALSLLFLVHPVLVSAVAWIPGRTDSFLATFVLISFINFLDLMSLKARGPSLMMATGLHFAAFILALLTKETAIVLPLLCFLYAYLVLEEKNFWSKQRSVVFSWVFIVMWWFIIRKNILIPSQDVLLKDAVVSLFQNLPSLISYFGKVFLPVNLSVLPIPRDLRLIYGIVAILGVVALSVFSTKKRRPVIYFGVSWFLLFLLPSLVLSFLNHEYRLYLPMIGCLLFLSETDLIKKWAVGRWGVALTAVVVLILSLLTFINTGHYKNRYAFWENAVKTSPHSPLAHRNLGAMYYLDGRKYSAEVEFKEALKLNSHEPMAHNNLGLIYADRKEWTEAEREYNEEVRINPAYDNVYMNLGLLYYYTDRKEEAVRSWERAAELNPKNISAIQNLAAFYYNQKDYKKASVYFRKLEAMGVPLPYNLPRERLDL